MATRFVVRGSDEEDEEGDLLYQEEVHVQVNGSYTVSTELEPNIGLTAPPTTPTTQSTAAAGSDHRMAALEAAMSIQSPGSKISEPAAQAATMWDPSASSEKRYSIPGMYRYCRHLPTVWQSD